MQVLESAPQITRDETADAAAVEALLLATGEPLSDKAIADLLGVEKKYTAALIEKLREKYSGPEFGIHIIELAGGFQFATKPEHSDLIDALLKEIKKVRLSPASLETLAIIAYRQPVTRTEIEEIRGVNVDGVMKTLIERELVKIVGKKDEPGRPLLYGTTENFLLHFGLRSLKDLPPLSEFDEIARARASGEVEDEPTDWGALSDSQREALDSLASAAERELADIDDRLKSMKPPKVVTIEEQKED